MIFAYSKKRGIHTASPLEGDNISLGLMLVKCSNEINRFDIPRRKINIARVKRRPYRTRSEEWRMS